MLATMTILSLVAGISDAHRGHQGLRRWVQTYFDTWNRHDAVGLRALLHDDAALRDWEVEKKGGDAVASANGAIWQSAPSIAIEVLKAHLTELTAVCEILVKVKPGVEPLKVVDVLEFDSDGKIVAVRAYKG